MPELLVLDEPTDGLDPPQIAEMRRVLKRYATDGRAVLVSSHLLAEVEQTCTHVVVVHKGAIVASGRSTRSWASRRPYSSKSPTWPRRSRVLDDFDGVRSVTADGGAAASWSTPTARPAARSWPSWSAPASGWNGWCPGAASKTPSSPSSATTLREAVTDES